MVSDGIGIGNSTPGQVPSFANMPGGGVPGNQGGGMMGTGTPGAFRLFGRDLAGQLSWLLPFALIGLIAWLQRPVSLSLQGLKETGLCGKKGLVLIAMVLWLVPGLLYFSFTTGFWHLYYLATIAPPLAALIGIGAVGMYDAYCGDGRAGWLLIAAVLATGITEAWILLYDAAWSGILVPITLIGSLAATTALSWMREHRQHNTGKYRKIIAFISIAVLFTAPVVWACTPLAYGERGILPLAGPQSGWRGGGPPQGFGTSGQGEDMSASLATYLLTHSSGETFLVAVPSSMNGGAALIIETGKPVMAVGGFGGMDQILTIDQLPDLIKNHTVRYFLIQGLSGSPMAGGINMTVTGRAGTAREAGTDSRGNSEIWAWVQEHCTEIPSSEWGGSNGRQDARSTLYDCTRSV
jgi:4-amino-4-deoxy-L-arabinose transferase-like glycosyltransferase